MTELRSHYSAMVRIRAFEERALRSHKLKLVRGSVHSYIGQEAVASGVCRQLGAQDVVLSSHRCHGHALARGVPARAMMAELLGRSEGSCGGKGGSMHIADFSVGLLGANGVVAANIVIAAGIGHAMTMRRDKAVVACFFGDGAVNRGPFLEGLNWAKVFRCPVLFVCEDNRYAAMTRSEELTAGSGARTRAESLGLQAVEVDGNDVEAVAAATSVLLADVRAGNGPALLHARTYRLSGHTATDAGDYRSTAELELAEQNDPIGRCRRELESEGLEPSLLDAEIARATDEMESAHSEAMSAEAPPAQEAYREVQDVGSPEVQVY